MLSVAKVSSELSPASTTPQGAECGFGDHAFDSNQIDELQTDASSPHTFKLLQIQLPHKYLQKFVKSGHQFTK